MWIGAHQKPKPSPAAGNNPLELSKAESGVSLQHIPVQAAMRASEQVGQVTAHEWVPAILVLQDAVALEVKLWSDLRVVVTVIFQW